LTTTSQSKLGHHENDPLAAVTPEVGHIAMPSRKSTSHLTLPLPVSPFEFARGNLNLHIWLVRTF
jgi:hypothetical protein